MAVHITKYALTRWMCFPFQLQIHLKRICTTHHLVHPLTLHSKAVERLDAVTDRYNFDIIDVSVIL